MRDSSRARAWRADSRRVWEAGGGSAYRPGFEAYETAMVALAEGRLDDAAAQLDEAERLHVFATHLVAGARFAIADRRGDADATITAGEAYQATSQAERINVDGVYRAAVLQRLGELYEARGNAAKALEYYSAFVELWKDADAELQPRVRDVRSRVERLRKQVELRG